jgi:hypothetical protein
VSIARILILLGYAKVDPLPSGLARQAVSEVKAITIHRDARMIGAVLKAIATSILNLMGMDHTKLTYRFNGRDTRLTDGYGDLIPRE